MFNGFLLHVRNNVFQGCPLEEQIAPAVWTEQTQGGEQEKEGKLEILWILFLTGSTLH